MAPPKRVPAPELSDVLNVYFTYVLQAYYPGDNRIEKATRSYIVDLQRADASDDLIYEALEELHEMLGNPMAFYESFIEGEDEGHKAATKAAVKVANDAEKARKRAAEEFANKRKCVELERETLSKQSDASNLTTATPAPFGIQKVEITAGSYVFVEADLSPGMCSHGGTGFVTEVQGEGVQRTFAVKYDQSTAGGGKEESGISYSRLTEVPTPFAASKLQRKRNTPENFAKENVPTPAAKPAPTGIQAILQQGYTNNRGNGWRAKDLGMHSDNRKYSGVFIQKLREDAKELQGLLSILSNTHESRGRGGLYKKRKSNYNPVSMKYLAKAWGVGKNFPTTLLKQQPPASSAPSPSTLPAVNLPVIDSKAAAKVKYTAKNMFISHRVRVRKAEEEVYAYDNGKNNMAHVFREEAKAEWLSLPAADKVYWESRSRSQITRQEHIADNIIEAMRANPSKSFEQIASDIGNWCSASTIQKWIASKQGYTTYAQRTLPLLTKKQKEKHVTFSKKLRRNWDLPAQKILWIHYDEKWFFGWVNRCNAKMCEILGIERTHTYIYHKGHVEKVMAVAFTAYAFDGNVENGGDGIKLGLYRVQAARIAKRDVRESRRDENDDIKFDGKIVRIKGQPYLVDCNVTGSNEGDSDKPKFSLLSLFRDQIFPKIAQLVGAGGEYEGYLPVIQGDNAGPHTDATFSKFVTDFCNEQGWKWEPQAPQMPHMNNLDLAVFPMMSKRHSQLLTRYSNSMVPREEIWEGALSVWRDMDSASVARGFILAYRIAEKVIDNKGENTFLQSQDFHSGVRSDFCSTDTGVKKKIRFVE